MRGAEVVHEHPAGSRHATRRVYSITAQGRVVEVRRAAGFDRDRAPYAGPIAPAAPADAFWALGWGNQLVAVVPSADVVAVRLGPKPAGPDDLTIDGFSGAVLRGLAGGAE